MLVVIPTYNRTSILSYVLKSVTFTIAQNERIKIIVVNNHPPTKEVVDEIMSDFLNDSNFEWNIIHREVTMTHVKSWYSAIATQASQNEAILMLGDDDFMLPWGIQSRLNAIKDNNADMLLTSFVDRLYFYKDNNHYWLSTELPLHENQPKEPCEWSFTPGIHPEASFVSNHTYRYTQNFKEGLELAFKWCDQQYWLAEKERMGMLPLYLPYAISLIGGKVISLNAKCVIRGSIVPDVYREEYAGGGSTGLFLLCAFDTFSNKLNDCYSPKLKIVANFYKHRAVTFDPSILLMKSVDSKSIYRLYQHAGLGSRDLLNKGTAKTILLFFIKKIFHLAGFRLRLIGMTKKISHIDSLFKRFTYL